MGLPDDASPMKVRDRWRELAKTHHPDHGGDGATFHKYRQAYTAAMAIAMKPKNCLVCGGSGSYVRRVGPHSLKMRCDACGGTGRPRENKDG